MELELSNGKYVTVDRDKIELLSKYRWCFDGRYAVTWKTINKKKTKIYMHRLLLDYNGDLDIDHINRNKLDNRVCNLRVCKRSTNCINTDSRKDNTSGKKGVSYDKGAMLWHAYINILGKRINIGYFKKRNEAILARKSKESELWT